jgi:hypothetical protein
MLKKDFAEEMKMERCTASYIDEINTPGNLPMLHCIVTKRYCDKQHMCRKCGNGIVYVNYPGWSQCVEEKRKIYGN